ncbi:MAG: UDP-3-O-(3-hydroxymyristoyl)glucosamine N-acyltransferase [Micavibrio sp.]|nr:UDP-3-O-(3-hydroxymyristoyl)glucosamine N-acyltransferase [Micavibrio sp.]
MPDLQFHIFIGHTSLSKISEVSGAKLSDDSSGDFLITGVSALDKAESDELSFLDNVRYKDQFAVTKAGACFVHPDLAQYAPDGVRLLISETPYKAYALAAQYLYPETIPESDVSPKASVSDSASIGDGCVIEAGVVIEDGVKLGDCVWIGANSVIGRNVQIGSNVRIGASATISHCVIGDHSRLYPGVCVGQDGFGFAIDPKGHVKVPQLGRVIIGDHVEIGANTTIDRGAGPDTVIGDGSWIDNLVQIGHNVRIGKGCIIVSQVGISGSTVLDDFVAVGGQAGIAGHLHIGMGARIAAQSGIMRNIPAGEEQMGSPALPIRQHMKQVAFLRRLGKKG